MTELTWADYSTMAFILITSGLVSLYFGYSLRKKLRQNLHRVVQKQRIGFFPILMSLTTSNVSGIGMLGIPVDVYLHGINYAFYVAIAQFTSTAFSNWCFTSVLYNLEIDSAYEYFEKRFDARLRKLASLIFVVSQIAYAAIAVYPCASVISQFWGISVDTATQGLTIFCTISTAIAGFQGVVWTDTYQAIIMWIFMAVLTTVAIVEGSGFAMIYHLSNSSDRLDIFFGDLKTKSSLSYWSATFGLGMTAISYSIVHPATFQRLVCLKSERTVRWVSYFNAIEVSVMLLVLGFCGLGMYSRFHGCDPKLAGLVENYLNTVIYFISEGSQSFTGLKGIFAAGITCGSLSTMSTNINTAATILYTEFIKKKAVASWLSEASYIQVLCGFVGAGAIGFVYLTRGSQSIMELYQGLFGGFAGLSVGLFILGTFCVTANSKGTFWGGIISLCFISFLTIGSRLATSNNSTPMSLKPLSTAECPFNITLALPRPTSQTLAPAIFRISSYYFSIISGGMTIVLGLIFSWLLRPKDRRSGRKLNRELFCPAIRKLFKDWFYEEVPLEETVMEETVRSRATSFHNIPIILLKCST